jgi:hypothetical protein
MLYIVTLSCSLIQYANFFVQARLVVLYLAMFEFFIVIIVAGPNIAIYELEHDYLRFSCLGGIPK